MIETMVGGGGTKVDETDDKLQAELERLRAENAALKARESREMRLKVSTKGAVSVYGLRRFPITFYADEWESLLKMADEIRAFIKEHEGDLKRKEIRS